MPRIRGNHPLGFRPQSSPPPATRVFGTTLAMNREPDPLVMLRDPPIDPDVQTMDRVMITGSGWPSIDGRFFVMNIVNASLAQLRLMGADTSGETVGAGAGATVAVEV